MNEQLIGDLFAAATGCMTGSTSREFSQKFAEEIVRECARIVTDAVDHCEPASTYADRIKQHFGVEL
jgi:hypothetical protein